MAQPSGSKVIGPCPYCGERYKLTNWMRRHNNPERDEETGRFLNNTHLIACHRKRQAAVVPPERD